MTPTMTTQLQVFSESNATLWKIQVAAAYANVPLKCSDTESEAKKSPVGKLPILQTTEGVIFEPNAICRYGACREASAP